MCRAEPQGIGGYHRGEETPVGAGEPPKPLVPLHALFRLGSSHQRDMINIDRPLWPLRDRVFRGVNVHTGNIPGQEGQGERGSGSSLGSKLHSRHLAPGSSRQRDMINIDRPLWPLRDRVFRGANVHTGNLPGREGQGERGSGLSLGVKVA